jgi:hypothetical protein
LADADVGSRIQQHCNGLVLVTQPGRRHGVGEPILKTAGTYGLGLWQNPSVRPIDTAKHKRVAGSTRIDFIQEAQLEGHNAKPNDVTGVLMLSQKGTPIGVLLAGHVVALHVMSCDHQTHVFEPLLCGLDINVLFLRNLIRIFPRQDHARHPGDAARDL